VPSALIFVPLLFISLKVKRFGSVDALMADLNADDYDPSTQRAWSHWADNSDDARVGKPIGHKA